MNGRLRLSRQKPAASPWGMLMSDLNKLYRENLSRRSNRGAQVGAKTQRDRRIVIERALRDLYARGLEVRRMRNIRGKHVRCVIEEWRGRGLKASTLATNVSHLRTLCRWLKKPELVRLVNDMIAAEPHLTRRQVATTKDRSERGAGVNREEIFRKARALDERFACQLALIVAFALRAQESWLFRPHLAVEGGVISIRWGTKGGRPRTLPLALTEEQRAVLEWARTQAATRADSMIPPGWRLERWRRRFYRLCARVGLTQKATGATPHSFRHGALLDLYEWLTGCPASARGGDLGRIDPNADHAARKVVAEEAGHGRISVASAYLGSPRSPVGGPIDPGGGVSTVLGADEFQESGVVNSSSRDDG